MKNETKRTTKVHFLKKLQWRWSIAFLMLLMFLPGRAEDISVTLAEKDIKLGSFYIETSGDKDDFDDCYNDIRNNQFYSISYFNNAEGRWCYEFFLHQYEPNAHDGEGKYNSIEGKDIQVWVYGASGAPLNIATIPCKENGDVTLTKDASTYGVIVEKGTSGGVYQFYPSEELMRIGFSKIMFSFHYHHNRNNKKDKGYEVQLYKRFDEDGIKFDLATVPWTNVTMGSDGYPVFSASGVPGGGEECLYEWKIINSQQNSFQGTYTIDVTKGNTGWSQSNKSNTINATTGVVRLSPFLGYYVDYKAAVGRKKVAPNAVRTRDNIRYYTPYVTNGFYEWRVLIPGYLYPDNLQISEFDQWNKQLTISWDAVREDNFRYDGKNYQRSTDGEWQVFREYYDGDKLVSTKIATLEGSKSDAELFYTDTELKYDMNYIYRVVFVPTQMIGTDISWFDGVLQPTKQINTFRDVPITLTQDRDPNLDGIKLDWTYSIQQSGSTFRVERQNESDGSWSSITDSERSVITSQTKDSYIDRTPNSTCEFYNYRVVANTLGTEFTSNELMCNLPAGTRITSIDATKGTEEKNVIVTWTVDQKGTSDTYFRIERRTISNSGTGEWIKAGEAHGTQSEYTFTDERVQAGSYYEYHVTAYGAECDEQVVQSDEMTTVGFSQATGTITGHVSYGSGNSVEGVHISLVKSGTDSDLDQFYSSYINGEGGSLSWTPNAARYGNMLTSGKPMTVQMWFAPNYAPINSIIYMPIFSLDGVMEVGLKEKANTSGLVFQLCCKDASGNENDLEDITVVAHRFYHITASYNGNDWTFYVYNGDERQTATVHLDGSWTLANDNNAFHIGTSRYDGLIDEVRIWNRALSADEVKNNYDRLLGGTENGLILYWPLDEGIKGYAFDISKQNGVNNQNHATVSPNVKPSNIVPHKLGLYGLTDADGNYIVKGVPFDAGGTNYKIVPEFGIHDFSPTSRNLYISPSSLTANNIDFTDKSSFLMNGFIYYKNTNIPAKGIYLYVDGNLVTTDGKVAETDENGYYNISVPIGEHYIEAKQSGHDMVDGGRWPTEGTHDFQSAVQHNFSDSTLVNFCGRVAGGEVQESLPVGFGRKSGSKNNIGTAVITLELTNPNLSFNCKEGTTYDNDSIRPFYSQNPDTINSTSWAGAGTTSRYIYIKTDSITGEFSALLPPLKYTVKSIDVPKNDEVEFTSLPEIDLTNPISFQVDTLMNTSDNIYNVDNLNNLTDISDISNIEDKYEDLDISTYKYNKKMVQAWYTRPTLEVTDLRDTHNIGAFGVEQYLGFEDEYGTIDSIRVYSINADNTPLYLYDYPIYKMKDQYVYKIKGYEKYTNNDSGSPIYDIIPMKSQVLTVENEMSSDQRIVTQTNEAEDVTEGEVYDLKANQLALDSVGEFTYKWTAGLPNTISPYTRHVSISYVRHNKTYLWDGIDALVFGSMPLGNNFVTKGPDNVLMVLRDPPGSNSYTSWTRGHVNTRITKHTNGWAGNATILAEIVNGVDIKQATGFGLAIISGQGASQTMHGGLDLATSFNNAESTTYTVGATETISTSSNKEYVGANGDVYIGVSTNLILGDCKKVGFFRDGPNDDTFAVKDSMAISISDSVATTFMYTQREIELKQIPEWEELRSQLLIPVASKEDALKQDNPTNESLYVTWQSVDSDEWKEGENYLQIPPKDGHVEEDMVNYYTAQINAWKQIMSQNEEDKVKSMSSQSKLYSEKRNFSFDNGTTYTYTSKNDTVHSDTWQQDYQVMAKGDIKMGMYADLGSKFGINLTLSGAFGYKGNVGGGDADENYTNTAQFTYTMSDTNIGSDYTVDAYKSLNGWTDIFSVLGGQTYCPYEGEVKTKYFEPGKHTLSNATAKMQNPKIFISNGNQDPSSHADLTDVPTGQSALFTLTLSNDAETDMGMTFVLGEKDGTNPNGLQFIVDGVRFNSGRSVYIAPGTTVTKTIEVRQTDTSILHYEDVMLTFASSCQNDLTSVNGVILDKCTLSVHFKPSSSPVTLKSDAFVVNTISEGDLNLTLTDFDRNFQGMERMGVEYKADGATTWTQVQGYVFNAEDAGDNDIVVPAEDDVKLAIDMSDSNSYPDGKYIFRAFTETPYGTDPIRVYSDELTVVRDMSRPTALGTPQPTDGILHFGDDLMVEYNEDIVPGYVNASNIQVTGKVNQQPTTHEVSLHLSGNEPTAHTANDLYMRGNSTVAMWIKYTKGGTIFQHCTGDNALTLSVDDEGHLNAKTGTIDKTSELTVPKDKWVYLAYSYDEQTTILDIIMQYDTETKTASAELGAGRTLQQVAYSDNKQLFLGGNGLEADIHDLRIYSIKRDIHEVAAEKYNGKNVYTAGLMAQWPMDEGQGTKARDLRNDSHPLVLEAPNWRIDNSNYAATVVAAKEQHIDLPIGTSVTDSNESYVLEFWFKTDDSLAGRTIFQAGNDADNNLRLFGKSTGELALEYGMYLVPVTTADTDMTGGWHHFALNVMRGQSASVTIDGKRTAVFSEADVPAFEGERLVLGSGFKIPVGNIYEYNSYMDASFDEVRFWKGVLKPEVVKGNMYHNVDTLTAAAQGLSVYYPMEAATTINGVDTKSPSDKDMAPGQTQQQTMMGNYDLQAFTDDAAPLKRVPEMQTVISNATVSDRKIAIQLMPTSLSEIEGTTLDITVNKIFDMNGNTSKPVTWQVYVHQNTLNWEKDSVNVIKNYGETATFDVVIKNTGNTTEYFSINDLPSWLTTDQESGELMPEAQQIIRFNVSKTAAVGHYDVNLSLLGNNNIAEPLRVVMYVKGDAPDWTVDTDKYEDHMNMVAQVIIDGIVSENPESKLAAFLGNECVGVAAPERSRGSYYVPMTIYGNNSVHKEQTVQFKFWDASTGETYTGMAVDPKVLFKKDSIKGSYTYPVIITNTGELMQQLTASVGWNWLSFYVLPESNAINDVMNVNGLTKEDVFKNKTQVVYYDGTGWNDGNLSEVNIGSMYKLKVQQPVVIEVSGIYNKPSETPVSLNYGWNWIGYTPTRTLEINQALGGTGAVEGDYIKSKTAFAIYGPYGWEGNLKALEPGKGYMFFTQQMDAHTFTYPDVEEATSGLISAPKRNEVFYFHPVDGSLYPDNMSMVIKLTNNGELVDTAEIAAFIDDECRATAKASNGLYYLMIQGEDSGQTIELKTIFNGQVAVIDQSQVFDGDTNIGLPWNPYVIDLGTTTGIYTVGDNSDPYADAKFYLPNGIEVDRASLRRGQVYIVKDKNGKTVKYRK